MNRLVILCLALLLAACQSIVKVEGEQVVGGRLALKLPSAWNQMPNPRGEPFHAWTQEGRSVDELRIWVGLRPGAELVLAPPRRAGDQTAAKVPVFRPAMTEEQLAHLFEVAYAVDGSIVKLTKLERANFAGTRGLRMEFTVTGQTDHVVRQAVVWTSEQRGELFAMGFVAPRLGFFPRMRGPVEAMAASATLRN